MPSGIINIYENPGSQTERLSLNPQHFTHQLNPAAPQAPDIQSGPDVRILV